MSGSSASSESYIFSEYSASPSAPSQPLPHPHAPAPTRWSSLPARGQAKLTHLPFLALLEVCSYLPLESLRALYHTHRALRQTVDSGAQSFFGPHHARRGLIERARMHAGWEEREEFWQQVKIAFWLTDAPFDAALNDRIAIEDAYWSSTYSTLRHSSPSPSVSPRLSHSPTPVERWVPPTAASYRTYARAGYRLHATHHLVLLKRKICFFCAFSPSPICPGPTIVPLSSDTPCCDRCRACSCGMHCGERGAVGWESDAGEDDPAQAQAQAPALPHPPPAALAALIALQGGGLPMFMAQPPPPPSPPALPPNAILPAQGGDVAIRTVKLKPRGRPIGTFSGDCIPEWANLCKTCVKDLKDGEWALDDERWWISP